MACAYLVHVGSAAYMFGLARRRGRLSGRVGGAPGAAEALDGDDIGVEVKDAQIIAVAAAATVQKARAAVNAAPAGSKLQVTPPADAALFRPGDSITIEGTAERAQIDRIFGDQIFLFTPLAAAVGAGSFLRIADLAVGQKLFRVKNPAGLEPGSVVHLDNGAVNNEDVVVDSVTGEFISVAGSGLAKTYGLLAADPAVAVTTIEFSLVLSRIVPPIVAETFDKLSMDPRHSRYFLRVVDSKLVNVSLPAVPGVQPPPKNRPVVGGPTKLLNGPMIIWRASARPTTTRR